MAGDDDVMVAERGTEHITRKTWSFYDNLCPAEIIQILIRLKFHILSNIRVKPRAYLEDCGTSGNELSVYGDTDSGLEMGIVTVRINHVQGNRAVGEKEPLALYPGEIYLESADTCQ